MSEAVANAAPVAEKPAKPNKSKAIREYDLANPGKSNSEVAEALKHILGEDAEKAAQYVASIRYTASKKGSTPKASKPTKGKKGRKPGAKATPSGLTVDDLLAAVTTVRDLGGVETLRNAVKLTKEFSDKVGGFENAEKALEFVEKLAQANTPAQTDAA